MDIFSLAAGKLVERSPQQPMSAREEQLYYERMGRPRLPRDLATSLATLAGAVLVLLVGAHVF
ncbi:MULTISPECIES: hypothetical protein [unclassified Devosia]|jgi:hypothetical protein|uniref:hypothetical protein n=1 Tax=unclassified Devosia TaxID=196773 RepID=UPI00086EBDFD|nr:MULTISPECIES: hypothetical protein [unclassified Devosia]MBN9362255.1 hypothetical protein [Devosia sp.]ODS80963.1 MAG: hypothetical protein ABS47_25150 [Devosia sp. SCN 66-27]OJX24496.1 MAG: hypothetical protein BGO83_07710 [Devosia sp. 66-14]